MILGSYLCLSSGFCSEHLVPWLGILRIRSCYRFLHSCFLVVDRILVGCLDGVNLNLGMADGTENDLTIKAANLTLSATTPNGY